MRVSEGLHQIQYVLLSVPKEYRMFLIYVLRQGLDSNTGSLEPMNQELTKAIRCVDCEQKDGECFPDCPYRVEMIE